MRLILFLLLISGACVQLSGETPDSASSSNADENWEGLAIGLEQRVIREGAVIFQAVRVDPELYTFHAHYHPGIPLSIEEWATEYPDAEVIINTNFFTIDNTVLGLLISDFTVYGTAYTDRGGMFYVSGNSAGIRSNAVDPYRGEKFAQAIQAFPMLVMNGQAVYSNNQDIAISRRTIIAQDIEGRIILMVTAGFGMSLSQLSQYLAISDLDILTALNLDGGGSSMMYINSSETTVLSFDPVPAVLAIYGQ